MKVYALTAGFLAALGFVHGASSAEDVMRCGGALIFVGMIAPQVVAKCGEPASQEVENVPIRAHGPRGSPGAKVGVTRIERWTYDLGYGKFKRLLTFEDGKLKSIKVLTPR